MSDWYEIELGDDIYEVEAISFEPFQAATFDSPAEGGEVELGDMVRINYRGGEEVKISIPLDDFIKVYADYLSLSSDLQKARMKLEDKVYEMICDEADY